MKFHFGWKNVNNTSKWNHPKENIYPCKYFMFPIKSNASKIFMAELVLILGKFDFRPHNTFLLTLLKINKPRYIALFVVSGSIISWFINFIKIHSFWTLDVNWTASYEITLVHLSVFPSLTFPKIGSLGFSDILHDDSRTWWYLRY